MMLPFGQTEEHERFKSHRQNRKNIFFIAHRQKTVTIWRLFFFLQPLRQKQGVGRAKCTEAIDYDYATAGAMFALSALHSHFKLNCRRRRSALFHSFYKSEHLVRSFCIFFGRCIGIDIIFAEKFNCRKAAFIYIEMNISLFKIGCTGFPNFCFWMQCLYCKPRAITDTLTVFCGQCEQNLKVIMVCILVNFENYSAYRLAVEHNAVGFVLRIVNTSFNSFTRDDFSVIVNVLISNSEFFCCTEFERILIIKNKLFSVAFF